MTRKRRDGEPTAEDQQQDDSGQKLENGYTKAMAEEDMKEIRTLNQQISDLQMKVASKFKSIEKAGGDRKTFKWAYQLRYQDPAKTQAQLAAFKEYCEWIVTPELEKAAAVGGGSEG